MPDPTKQPSLTAGVMKFRGAFTGSGHQPIDIKLNDLAVNIAVVQSQIADLLRARNVPAELAAALNALAAVL